MSAEAQAGDSAQTAGDARIDVGDLSFSLSNADLEKIKEKIGNVLQAQVILRGDKHLGYGDLKLRSPEESPADGAFDGILKVVKPRNAKKGRGAATRARGGKRGGRARRSADDPASGEEATNDEAAGQNGIVKTVTDGVAAVTDGISKLVSGESAATTEGGEKAARGGKAGKGRGGKAKAPRPKKERGEPSKTLVFIRNLPFSLTEEGLGSLFKENNLTYSSLSMPTWRFGPRKGKGRGYAFATVASEEEQTKAIETLNGKEMATGEMIKPAPAADGTPAAEDAAPVERKLKLVARQGYENEDKTVEQEHEAEGAAAETPGTNGTGIEDSGTA